MTPVNKHAIAVIRLKGENIHNKKEIPQLARTKVEKFLFRTCFKPKNALAVKLGITLPPIMISIITIKNNGKEADQLLGAKGNISSSVEIHEMQLDNNVMKMRAVPEVQIPAGYEVTFKHGQANGYHLMLIDIKKPLKQGDKFELTLNFKKSGDCRAEFWVEAPKADTHQH